MTAKYLTSILISLSIFLCTYAQLNAVPNEKVFEIRSPLMLYCDNSQPGVTLTWEKDGVDVTKVKELENRYKIFPEENKFQIDKTEATDGGNYACVGANNERKEFIVYAKVIVGVPSNIGVVEGEKLTIVCSVLGTNPKLSWSIGNMTISNSTDRYILKADANNVENAILTIDNISMDDGGEYKCIGRSPATPPPNAPDTYLAYDNCHVRVKGKFAALWPFLGICAEVFILCTIIFIYEKRRNKSELEESDTDPQEQ